jgi:uncharacterized protein YlaI
VCQLITILLFGEGEAGVTLLMVLFFVAFLLWAQQQQTENGAESKFNGPIRYYCPECSHQLDVTEEYHFVCPSCEWRTPTELGKPKQ